MNPRPDDPKGAAGSKKCPLHLIPPHAMREIAEVMRLGAEKYQAHNWRHNNVCASTYVGAMLRHLTSWWDGELNDPESLRSHLAHVAASAIIVMDAMDQGTLNLDLPQDNRKVVPLATEAAESTEKTGYRFLNPDEILQEGDEWGCDGEWLNTINVGRLAEAHRGRVYRRPLHADA